MTTHVPPTEGGTTDDLSRQLAKVNARNRIEELLAARQKPLPGPCYWIAFGAVAGITALAWGVLSARITGHDSDRVGLAVAVWLAVAGVATLATVIVAVGGAILYVVSSHVGNWDKIAKYRDEETHRRLDDLENRLSKIHGLLDALVLDPERRDRQQKWDDLADLAESTARAAHDRNAPPNGVVPIVSGRPTRNRSTS